MFIKARSLNGPENGKENLQGLLSLSRAVKRKNIPLYDSTLFFSLSTTISLAEKCKVIFDKFLGSVGQKTLYAWTLEWESEIHPSRENHRIRLDKIPVQQFFCSLPIEMPIKEKRERVCAEFPSVAQRTIYGLDARMAHRTVQADPRLVSRGIKGKQGFIVMKLSVKYVKHEAGKYVLCVDQNITRHINFT